MHYKKYIVMCLCPRGTVFGVLSLYSSVPIAKQGERRSHAFQGNFNSGNGVRTRSPSK